MDIFLGVLFVVICVLLIVVVLIQKGRGGGIGAAFGGGGSSAFGTRTGDVFTWVTIVLVALFLLLAIGTSLVYRPEVFTVASPIVNPQGREIDKETLVMLDCSTPGAKLYYTLDGSEPTDKSTPYSGVKISVMPDTTVKCRAYKKDWDPSEITVATFPKLVKKAETPTTQPATTTAPGTGE